MNIIEVEKRGVNALIVVVGTSGSGKTHLTNEVLGKDRKVVTYTTRPMRTGEIDGVDYNFMSREEFENKIEEGFFLEYSMYDEVNKNYYGTSIESLKEVEGIKFIILDTAGYISLLGEDIVDVIGLYIDVSKEQVAKSMEQRGDKQEDIEGRLEKYDKERLGKMLFANQFQNKFTKNSEEAFKDKIWGMLNEKREE